ncbi:MAG: ferrochelatase [Leptospiraceae bacterium]|nr:ferrochelatase [Leptospiraceae bacterium]MCP5496756.1 ferrochelatase [Leptospiraceae bacterium]
MKKRVLLINFGGPRNPAEIEKFLWDVLSDPFVFDVPLPEFFRLKLAKFITKRRTPEVAKSYLKMGFGGGSPLVPETEKQAKTLETLLKSKTGEDWSVDIAMTAGYPNLRDMEKSRLIPSQDNILLPLFPHFSRSTVLSVVNIIEQIIGTDPRKEPGWIGPFYKEPSYLQAATQLILDYFYGKLVKNFIQLNRKEPIEDWQNLTLVYSAHGIPMRLIKKGDTYVQELEDCRAKITTNLRKAGFMGRDYLSFQSRVGKGKWTEPNTIDMLKQLGNEGVKRVAIIPISFVSDHLETLFEIGEELKEIAHKNGIIEYYRVPASGIYPMFIETLAKLVMAVPFDYAQGTHDYDKRKHNSDIERSRNVP